MKNLRVFVLAALFFSCAHEAPPKPAATQNSLRNLACPAQGYLSSGITHDKPKNAEDFVRLAVMPPLASKEWNINGFASLQQNLYLSCYYSSKKIITFKLPLQNEFCIAKDADKKLFVECIKK
ncbi:MAG: hypothetical protein H7328_03545 [Bdellovibrio sp.]|nr:hypothetical protein [Bdellovibrio sp.]